MKCRAIGVIVSVVASAVTGGPAAAELLVYEGWNNYVPAAGEIANVGGGGVGIPGMGLTNTIGIATSYESGGYCMPTTSNFGGDYTGGTYDWQNPSTTNVPYPTGVNATAAMAPLGNHLFSPYITGMSAYLTSSATFGDSKGAGSYYASYLMNKWYDSNFGQVTLTAPGVGDIGWGYGGGNKWSLGAMGGTVQYWNPATSDWTGTQTTQGLAPNHTPTWLVVKMDFSGDGGNDTATMYVNPRADQDISLATPFARVTDKNFGDISKMGVLGWGRYSRSDEYRVANSWSNLVNSSPVDQGVSATTVTAASDIRTGVGHSLRREATADGQFTPGSGTISTGGLQYWQNTINTGSGLVKFDLDEAGVPAGATITSAKVVLTGWMLFDGNGTDQLKAYKVTSDWDDTTNLVEPTVDTSAAVASDLLWRNGLIELDITALAQGWADGSIADYGLMIRGEDTLGNTVSRYLISREQMPMSDATWAGGTYPNFGQSIYGLERPVLIVDWTTGPRIDPGDINKDGTVDLQDFGVLKDNFGMTEGATWEMGDLTGDGQVDLQDFGVLKDHFGHTTGDSELNAVPEPMTLGLLALGALAIRRKR